MKEVYINNIKIAKKLEDLGLYNEADKIDNINMTFYNRVIQSSGPEIEDFENFMGRNFSSPKFFRGIEASIQKLTGKKIDIMSKLPTQILGKANTLLSKIFGYGGIAFGAGSFFINMANDPSGAYGDSPRDKALIVSNISQVISGLGMLSAASGSGTVGVFVAFAAAIVQVLSSIIAEYLEDDYNYGKETFSPKELVNEAFMTEFPESKKPFDKINPSMVTPFILKSLKARITLIGAKRNIKTQDVQAAHAIVDSITSSNPKSQPMLYQEMKNKQKGDQKSSPKPQSIYGNPTFDIPIY